MSTKNRRSISPFTDVIPGSLGYPLLPVVIFFVLDIWLGLPTLLYYPLNLSGLVFFILGLLLISWCFRTALYLPKEPILVTWGPWAYVRHPIYLAGVLINLGVSMMIGTALLLLQFVGYTLFETARARENFKEYLAEWKRSEAYKHTTIAAYTLFLEVQGLKWEPPKCDVTRKLPFIPTEKEIDSLIAGCGKKTAAFLQLLKETAMRCGEANRLEWTDIDFERITITLNKPEKKSKPRIFNVSSKLIAMLNMLPRTNVRIFPSVVATRRRAFDFTRKSIAKKLQNPRLLRITFHTIRHWKATMLYHQTKDILYVKEFLGHTKIENTLLYIQLERVLFKETTDEFTVRIARKTEEIKELLEVGFEYICEKDGLLFLRKRK